MNQFEHGHKQPPSQKVVSKAKKFDAKVAKRKNLRSQRTVTQIYSFAYFWKTLRTLRLKRLLIHPQWQKIELFPPWGKGQRGQIVAKDYSIYIFMSCS
jgi:hypothetical protein